MNGKNTADTDTSRSTDVPSWSYTNDGFELEIQGDTRPPVVEDGYADLDVSIPNLAGAALSVTPRGLWDGDRYTPQLALSVEAGEYLSLQTTLDADEARALAAAIVEAADTAEEAIAAAEAEVEE
jgi:hypothetical protein